MVDIEESVAQSAVEKPTVRWWHRFHRWTFWGKPYSAGGFNALANGGQIRQRRSCVRCGLLQDRRCEVAE